MILSLCLVLSHNSQTSQKSLCGARSTPRCQKEDATSSCGGPRPAGQPTLSSLFWSISITNILSFVCLLVCLLELLACRPAYGQHMLRCLPSASTSGPWGPNLRILWRSHNSPSIIYRCQNWTETATQWDMWYESIAVINVFHGPTLGPDLHFNLWTGQFSYLGL